MQSKKNQAGFTLIELMISMTLGIVVTGAIGVLFVNTNTSNRMQRGIASVQDGGRFATLFLREELQRAGWSGASLKAAEFGMLESAGPHIVFTAMTTTTNSVANDPSTDGGANGDDSITIQYRSDTGNTSTCSGTSVLTGGVISNHYYVENNQLLCRGGDEAVGQPILSGIERLEIDYGLDTDANGAVERYVTAAEVTAATVDYVRAIRFGLLLRSEDNVMDVSESRTYSVLGKNVAPAAADRRFRQVFSSLVFVPVNNSKVSNG